MKDTGILPMRSRSELPVLRRFVLLAALVAAGLWSTTGARADDHLPVPWNGIDIGSPTQTGGSQAENGTFTVTAGGAGLSGGSDQFHYVYQSVTGDFALIARVTFSPGSNDAAEAGLMVRDALAATSNFVAIVRTPRPGVLFQYRTPCAPRVATDAAGASGPVWIRLVKRGTMVDGYLAADANNAPGTWKKVGGGQPIASGMVYVGFCLASQSPGTNCRATFDHVSLAIGLQPLLDNGPYAIVPAGAPALVLNASDAGVTLGSPGPKWVFTGSGGLYAIHPSNDSSRVLAVAGGGSADGTRIVTEADRKLPSERWAVVPNANGTYGLVPQCVSGSGLDDFGGNATPAAHIDLWERWDGDPHTEWTLTPAP